METLQKFANKFAREKGWGRATKITISDTIVLPKLGKTVQYGYRKKTTGQYVPNAYRKKFGWKNTFYQPAVCEVIIPRQIANRFANRYI